MSAGRPTDYREEFNEVVEKVCRLGATDKEIAEFLDVSEATINNWKIQHPKFLESIKRGKTYSDANVADRLYQRAIGFEHDSEEIKVVDKEIARVPVRKIYPPDPTAAIFWLKNRRPKDWRDKQEIDQKTEHSGSIDIKWQEPPVSDTADKGSD